MSRRATSHNAVRDLVVRLGQATVPAVAAELGVSDITAWRYLNQLVDRGELERAWVTAERAWVYARPGQGPAPEVRVVDCSHKEARHRHGTRLAYVLDGCRCTPCRASHGAEMRRRNRAKAYGRPTTTWVDAAPVRAHVHALQAAGLGHKRIAKLAGVNPSSVGRLLYGRRRQTGDQEPPTRRMNPDDARRLLAVPMPDVDQLGATVNVDGTGTRRRLQALVAVGWPQKQLAVRIGMEPGNFGRTIRADRVRAATVTVVRALYDELWDQRPDPGRGPTLARRYAADRGWPPPAAWDDDTIDDPAALPVLDEDLVDVVDQHAVDLVLDGQPMTLTGRDLEVAALALIDRGLDYAGIAACCRSDVTTVRRVLNTARQRAARAGAKTEAAA